MAMKPAQMQEPPAFLPSSDRSKPSLMLEEVDQPMTVQEFMNREDPDKHDGHSQDGLLQ